MATDRYLVSGDSHLQIPPDFWTHRVPAEFRDLAPKRVKRPEGGEEVRAANGKGYWGATGSYAGHTPETFDPMIAFDYDGVPGAGGPAQRLQEQDLDSTVAEVMFPGSSAVFGINVGDRPAYLAMVRAYNDYLAEEYAGYAPNRIFGVGMLPSGDLDLKIAEIERFKKIGLRAASLHELPSGQPYPVPEDDRFWAAALDLEMPVAIHTTITRSRQPLFKYDKEPTFERPPDDFIDRIYRHANASRSGSLTICQLIFAGVFDRFPKLHIYFAENQIGWIPFYLEQLDIEYEKNHVWAERHFGIKALSRRPSDYVREHAYWGFFDDPIGVKLRHEIGVDRVVWGSDFPHVVTRWPNSLAVLDEHMAGVPDDERRLMQSENILRFLGIAESDLAVSTARA